MTVSSEILKPVEKYGREYYYQEGSGCNDLTGMKTLLIIYLEYLLPIDEQEQERLGENSHNSATRVTYWCHRSSK